MKYFTEALLSFALICIFIILIGGLVVCCTHYRSVDCKSACGKNNVESCGWIIKCMAPEPKQQKCIKGEYL